MLVQYLSAGILQTVRARLACSSAALHCACSIVEMLAAPCGPGLLSASLLQELTMVVMVDRIQELQNQVVLFTP